MVLSCSTAPTSKILPNSCSSRSLRRTKSISPSSSVFLSLRQLPQTNTKKRGHTIMSLHENSSDEKPIPTVRRERLSLPEESAAEHVDEQMEQHRPVQEVPDPSGPEPMDTNEPPSDIPIANYATRDSIKDS